MTVLDRAGAAAPRYEPVDFDPFADGVLERSVPATEAQREIWLAARQGREASLAYNESVTLRLDGPLDPPRLRAALDALVDRHDALRTSFGDDGRQLLVGRARRAPDSLHDLRGLAPAERERALARLLETEHETPFDLERGPLVRQALVRLGDESHLLLLGAHHLVCDGWSFNVLVEELGALYAGRGAVLPPAPSYAEHALRELHGRAGDGSAALDTARAWWTSRYADGAPVLELPLDHPRPPQRRLASRRVDRCLTAALVEAARRYGAQRGCSLYATLLTAFAALLQRLTGQSDLVVGSAAAGQATLGEPGLVGHCVALLPVRLAVPAAQPFEPLLQAVGTALLDAQEHSSLGYGALLRELPLARDASRPPLVAALFNLDPAGTPPDFGPLATSVEANPRRHESFELFVNAVLRPDGLRLEAQYATALFDGRTVARWLALYESLLGAALRDPAQPIGRLDWLDADERAALAALQPGPTVMPAWTLLPGRARGPVCDERRGEGAGVGIDADVDAGTGTDADADPVPLMHAGFVHQAAAAPGRLALRHADVALDYGQLDRLSNRLARVLRGRGVRRGDAVGLALPRGPEMVVGLLGILKAGASYVPLDPSFPAARLDFYASDAALAQLLAAPDLPGLPLAWCDDAAARVLWVDAGSAARAAAGDGRAAASDRATNLGEEGGAGTRRDGGAAWLAAVPAPLPPSDDDARPDDTAYVIYTSGSTGQPKGVRVTHRGVANLLASLHVEPGLGPDDVVAAISTLAFDMSVLDTMLPLSAGAAVLVLDHEVARDGGRLAAALAAAGATLMTATPGRWRMLLDAGWRGGPRFRAMAGGEAVPIELGLDLADATGGVWNIYGPTETTVLSTLWALEPEVLARRGTMSIGRPVANTPVWILDAEGRPCPIGVPGEIVIGGPGVAAGYLARPGLTAERFVSLALPTEDEAARCYRTGDLGRWCNDGLLEHLGRLDFQVKLRGYRIELGEIESVCMALPGIAEAVALVREDRPGDRRLVLYTTRSPAEPAAALDEAALRAHLAVRLPGYMLPQHWVELPVLPRLASGKVDRLGLPPPLAPAAAREAPRAAPRDELEREVLEAMEDALSLPGLDLHDDFFAQGGHSLLAARLTARLNRATGLALPVSLLFEAPTAARLAEAVRRLREGPNPVREPVLAEPGRRRAPLTPAQERVRFVEELRPGRVLYNAPSAHRLAGPLDRAVFEATLREIVRRQPSLRSRLAADDAGTGPALEIADEVAFELPFEDLSAVPAAGREAVLMARLQARVDVPQSIHRAPLFRVALYRLAAEDHAFFFMPHHLVWDGWSFDLLYEEFAAIYPALLQGRPHTLPPLAITHGDWAAWLARWLRQPECAAQLDHWRRRHAAAPLPAAPRTDRPRRHGMTGVGATRRVALDRARTERLREIARAADVTLSMLMFGLYGALMAGIAGSRAIVIGLPVRGRLAVELEPVMGYCNNLLAVPLTVEAALPLPAWLAAVKRELLDGMRHQDVPFERVAADPAIAARAQRAGLYQALFSFQDARARPRAWGPLTQQMIPLFQKGATEDLGLWLMEVPGGLEGGFTYNADLYDAATAADFDARWQEILGAVEADPAVTLGVLLDGAGTAAGQRLRRLAHDAQTPDAYGAGGASRGSSGADAASGRHPAPGSSAGFGPDAEAGVAARSVAAVLPSSDEEREMARLWGELLDLDPALIRAGDGFFDIGGDSLLAMRAVDRCAKALGFRVEARRYMFETLAQLAVREAPGNVVLPTGSGARRLVGRVLGVFGRRAGGAA